MAQKFGHVNFLTNIMSVHKGAFLTGMPLSENLSAGTTRITLQNWPWPTSTLFTFIIITIETLFTIWKANHKPKSNFYSSNFLRTSLSSCFHALVAPRSVGSSVIDNSLTGLGNELGQWQCPHISTLGPAAGPRHSWEIRGHNHERQH